MDLVVAARSTRRIDWLQRMVRRDMIAACPAHQRRAVFLEPLLTLPKLKEMKGGRAASPQASLTIFATTPGFWVSEKPLPPLAAGFAEAETREVAYACWRLFQACSDRRAWIWMEELYESHVTKDQRLEAAKERFAQQEVYALKRTMADNEKSWAGNFAGRKYTNTLAPWNSR